MADKPKDGASPQVQSDALSLAQMGSPPKMTPGTAIAAKQLAAAGIQTSGPGAKRSGPAIGK